MYTVQSLWTQAREKLNVITIICDNGAYAILKVECARQRLPPAGAATRALTSLAGPNIDWVSLARGMGVPAVKAASCTQLREALGGAVRDRVASPLLGPFLIQACIP